MTENTIQDSLDELQHRLSTLQKFAYGDPRQVRVLFPEALVGLQRSLDELNTLVAEPSGKGGTESNASSRNDASRSTSARRDRGTSYRALAERGPVLVRIMDTEMRCRWANRAWTEFTGRDMDQLSGESWLRDVHPDDRERCAASYREAHDSSRLHGLEYRLPRRGGEHGWVLEIWAPRLTPAGSVGGYLGVAIEITARRQAETHLALQYAVTRVLSDAETLPEAATAILQVLCETLGWDVGQLWTVEAPERIPRCVRVWASSFVDISTLEEGRLTKWFPSGAGPPWQSGMPNWIADIAADASFALDPEAERLGLHGMFRLPVTLHGEVCALLRVFSRRVRQRDDAQMESMSAVGTLIGQFMERQRTEERIRESEARKTAILEASLDAVITMDEAGRVVEFNAAAEKIFGYRREDVAGRQLLELIVPPRLREQALDGFNRYRTTGESGLLGKRFDSFAMKSDGAEFPVEVAVAPIGIGDQPLLTIYVCDATARKRAEQEVKLYQERLRSLMADLLLAEEHERRRLSVDLHDGLSQTIALAQMKLATLRPSLEGKAARALVEVEELIDHTNRTARSISFELSPPVLHDLGLEPAVQWLVESIHQRYGIDVVLEDDGRPKPADEKIRVILFRSIRELLINAAKHARARRVHVRLQLAGDQLNASVEDDGVGMHLDGGAVEGTGLLSIRERLSHVGGGMKIESGPGRGTKVRLYAPIASGKSTKARVEA